MKYQNMRIWKKNKIKIFYFMYVGYIYQKIILLSVIFIYIYINVNIFITKNKYYNIYIFIKIINKN